MNGWLGDSSFDAIVERDLAEGQHRNPTNQAEWFTTAYFHHPARRSRTQGLTLQAIFGIEGPGWLLQDKLGEPNVRERVLRVAEAVEAEPTLVVRAAICWPWLGIPNRVAGASSPSSGGVTPVTFSKRTSRPRPTAP